MRTDRAYEVDYVELRNKYTSHAPFGKDPFGII